MSASTTKMSLDYMRSLGYLVDVVERWVGDPKGGQKIKKDLFGCLDLLGVRDGVTVGVQTTSKANMSARARKMAAEPNVDVLLDAGWLLTIHGWWQPRGPRTRWEMEEIILGRDVGRPRPAPDPDQMSFDEAAIAEPKVVFPNLIHQADETRP